MEESRVELLEETALPENRFEEIKTEAPKPSRRKKKSKKKGKKKENVPLSFEQAEEAYLNNPVLMDLVNEHRLKKREDLLKRLHGKIRVKEQNRQAENAGNVKYDENGKKVGRLQKEYMDIPEGKVDTPAMMEKLRKVLVAVSSDPALKEQFLEKTGLTEELASMIMNQGSSLVEDPKTSEYESVEKVL
jgi:hypothetical protein